MAKKKLKPLAERKKQMTFWKKKITELHSRIIRTIEPSCVICGESDPTKIGVGHIFGRRALNTKWDIHEDGNCHTQCSGCNIRHEEDSTIYYQWYIDKFGERAFDKLRERFYIRPNWKWFDLEEIYEKFKKDWPQCVNRQQWLNIHYHRN